MKIISDYLENRTLGNILFEDIPAKDTGIIIIIPAFDEPGIIFTLDSLHACKKPPCNIEILVLVNAPSRATEAQVLQNTISCEEMAGWKNENKEDSVNLLYHNAGIRQEKQWGVGMARKTLMDEALRRFSLINNPGGVIASLDADCLVADDYLLELYNRLYCSEKHKACSIYFEHPLEGDLKPELYEAIAGYELHLRYYYQGLKYTGFPRVFQTIGSAIAVKAEHYARAGGMNKRQGAEDFYFIQKVLPAGGYFYLNTTTVIPSPRISGRVPFGTGPMMAKMTGGDDLYLYTYNPSAFDYLKMLFDNIDLLYEDRPGLSESFFDQLHVSMRHFLENNDWQVKIREIRNNTSSPVSFKKRFYNWFNMFRIVKYLNFIHSNDYLEKIPVEKAAKEFLEKIACEFSAGSLKELLKIYREMEK